MLTRPPITDTRLLFRPMCEEFIGVLRALPADRWLRPTVAGSWRVRDVVAHLVDVGLRRVSFHRDRLVPPPPPDQGDFVGFINALNAEWVRVSERLSAPVLLRLYEHAAAELCDFAETFPLDGPALFPVSWAGEAASTGWFDLGREFTEVWHHQMQVRDAVGAADGSDPRWIHAVLCVALRGVPHAMRTVDAAAGAAVRLEVTGQSGGTWALIRGVSQWELWDGRTETAAATLRISDGLLGRMLFNAVPLACALAQSEVMGDETLARAVLRTRSVVV